MVSRETMASAAMKMVIMDAIEKGATQQDIIDFMKTEECKKAVQSYMDMFEKQFGKKEEKAEVKDDWPELKKTYTYRKTTAIKPSDLAL